jgi:hypothetical protein
VDRAIRKDEVGPAVRRHGHGPAALNIM